MINSHIGILTEIISQDLTYFSTKFIECRFVTQTAISNIFTTQGISNSDKASQLLDRVTTNYKIAPQKQEWIGKFVDVFSSQPAYEGLAVMLTGETDPPGMVIQSYCTLYIIILQFWPSCVVWIIIAILQQALHYDMTSVEITKYIFKVTVAVWHNYSMRAL